MARTKILTLGGAGFIMSNFVRYLLKHYSNYEVVSVDNITHPKTLNSLYANRSHKFHLADITDNHIVNMIFESERPDIIIHGASVDKGDNILNTNIIGTQNLIDACHYYGVNKFIYLSDSKVYGDSICSQMEGYLVNPRDTYSISKVSAEMLFNTADFKYNILRLSSTFGPRQSVGLIPYIYKSLLSEEPIFLTDVRENLTHVQDVCSGIVSVLEKGKDNEIYNISSNSDIHHGEVLRQIQTFLNKKVDCIDTDTINTKQFVINSDKLRALGWSEQWKLNEAIAATATWYNNNSYFLR